MKTTLLPMVSTFTDTGKKDLEFADGATIKVRKGEKGDPSDPRGYTVQKRDDGVYIMTGMKIIVR